MHQSY